MLMSSWGAGEPKIPLPSPPAAPPCTGTLNCVRVSSKPSRRTSTITAHVREKLAKTAEAVKTPSPCDSVSSWSPAAAPIVALRFSRTCSIRPGSPPSER